MVTDVFVAGGGPAGLAAAIAARAKGFRVTLVDPGRPPIDKACGEGLMPDALASLAQLGVPLDSGVGRPFRGIRFLGEGTEVAASFPYGAGLAVRRTVLHRLLIQRAEEAGVQLLWGKRVTGIRNGAAELDGCSIACKWVVGADGQTSPVRRWAGLSAVRRESKRYGFRRHYQLAPWTDCVEVHWGDGCQVYVTPVGREEVGIALVTRDPHLRLDSALNAFPNLQSRLEAARHTSTERGAISVSRTLRHVANGQVALIGDASGSVDAITGEGLGLAFQQALALADGLRSGTWQSYERAHPGFARRPARMGSLLLLMDRYPWLRRRVLHALNGRPDIFASMLGAHVGTASPQRIVFGAAIPLGLRLLHP